MHADRTENWTLKCQKTKNFFFNNGILCAFVKALCSRLAKKKVQLFSLSKVDFYKGWKPICELYSKFKRSWKKRGERNEAMHKQFKNEAYY